MNLINFLDCTCGGLTLDDTLSRIIKTIFNVIRIGIPLILIVIGMIDMGKAITQQKEEDIKKAQGLLVKKAIAAALVFLIPSITTMLVGAVGSNDESSLRTCSDCLFYGKNNTCTAKESKVTADNCADEHTATPSGDTCTCTKK